MKFNHPWHAKNTKVINIKNYLLNIYKYILYYMYVFMHSRVYRDRCWHISILRLINNIFPGILIRLFLTDKLSTYFHKCATDGKLATRLLTNIYSPKYKRFVFSRISSTCLCDEFSYFPSALSLRWPSPIAEYDPLIFIS